MKILIYGAGVIGQIYAARLHEAGHHVTVLARDRTLEALTRDGITLVNGALVNRATSGSVRVNVTGYVGPGSSFELALVTVRRDQVDEILPAMAELQASHVVMMQNNSLELASVGDIVGRDRTLFGFPGVGGYRREDGAIEYIEIPQQPTTLGRRQGREEIVGEVFKSAGFAVATTADMDGWLKTHAVFIAAICGSINSCGGDAVKLAADRERVATMVRSAGEGFRALTSKGVAVQPRPLRMIFTVVPLVFAVRYWQGQLRGTVGTVALAPHSKMTKDTELPVLCRDVQKLVGGTVPTPHLDKLLSLTPLLCLAASRAWALSGPLSGHSLAFDQVRDQAPLPCPDAAHGRAGCRPGLCALAGVPGYDRYRQAISSSCWQASGRARCWPPAWPWPLWSRLPSPWPSPRPWLTSASKRLKCRQATTRCRQRADRGRNRTADRGGIGHQGVPGPDQHTQEREHPDPHEGNSPDGPAAARSSVSEHHRGHLLRA